jgi:hypothetical protein
MYEGQPIICKEIIEENWLEYLGYVKKQADAELERQQKRMEALKDIDNEGYSRGLGMVETKPDYPGEHRYYDININSFWSWYITNKVEVK